MSSRKSAPLADDLAQLEAQRQLVLGAVSWSDLGDTNSIANKLTVLQRVLDQEVFAPDQTYELQSLGVLFGDAFVQRYGLIWVMCEDEYGRDPALSHDPTIAKATGDVSLFPLTMISKRVEDGEIPDVTILFEGVGEILQDEFGVTPVN